MFCSLTFMISDYIDIRLNEISKHKKIIEYRRENPMAANKKNK